MAPAHIVVDTSAFLSAAPLQNLYIVLEVLAEIRDRPTCHRLAALPYELRLRRPRPDLLLLIKYRGGPAELCGTAQALRLGVLP
uniref:Ribonuclease PIN domain-containing protein n=1 Tax=Strigops habroptila TaxID=2489341 RepID=A0A672TF35_STRHB